MSASTTPESQGLTSLLNEVKQKLDEIENILTELKNYVEG